jgi:hypothetical protein
MDATDTQWVIRLIVPGSEQEDTQAVIGPFAGKGEAELTLKQAGFPSMDWTEIVPLFDEVPRP